MEFKDISLGKEGGKPEKPLHSSDTIEIGKEKIHALETAISEIKDLIKEREVLSKSIFEDAQKEKRDIDNFLFEVKAKTDIGETDDSKERISLRQKRVELSELQLNEKISCWQDVARLKQELRDKEKELAEKQGRAEMLSGILEGE